MVRPVINGPSLLETMMPTVSRMSPLVCLKPVSLFATSAVTETGAQLMVTAIVKGCGDARLNWRDGHFGASSCRRLAAEHLRRGVDCLACDRPAVCDPVRQAARGRRGTRARQRPCGARVTIGVGGRATHARRNAATQGLRNPLTSSVDVANNPLDRSAVAAAVGLIDQVVLRLSGRRPVSARGV